VNAPFKCVPGAMPKEPGMLVGLRRLVNRQATKPTG
jgi:hypothetical protein